MSVIIRILQETDAPAYQELRLTALQTNPEAFGSTFEREAAFSLETVKERIRPNEDKFVIGAFADGETLKGIATFVRDTGMKTSHKANVYGMYIANDVRGQGVGKAVLLALIEQAKACEGLEQIHLTVVSDNESAKRLYQSAGFETYGVEPNALKYDGRYSDEDWMVLRLLGSIRVGIL